MSVLTKSQYREFRTEKGDLRIKAIVRFDDQCGNGHNTFSITGEAWEDGRWSYGGCIHDEIAEHFPELAHLIKWHLCSTDGPMHYVANTVYLAGDRDCWGLRLGEVGKHGKIGEGKDRQLDAARQTAVWPDATDEELTSDGLKDRLIARLPALLADFRKDIEDFGFTW